MWKNILVSVAFVSCIAFASSIELTGSSSTPTFIDTLTLGHTGGTGVTAVFKANQDNNFLYLDQALRITGGQFYNNSGTYGSDAAMTMNPGTTWAVHGSNFDVSTVGLIVTIGYVNPTGTGASYLNNSNPMVFKTAPTISSGFGTSPSIATNNGTAAFTVNVGTGGVATSGVIGLPTATAGWVCSCFDLTTQSATVFMTKQTASSTTSCTIGNFNTAAVASAWVASDILHCMAMGR